jgi:hypothetical protein
VVTNNGKSSHSTNAWSMDFLIFSSSEMVFGTAKSSTLDFGRFHMGNQVGDTFQLHLLVSVRSSMIAGDIRKCFGFSSSIRRFFYIIIYFILLNLI